MLGGHSSSKARQQYNQRARRNVVCRLIRALALLLLFSQALW